ncbi:hypothetical protein [Pseudonocardia sp. T1-2H]|uniref:hypothetical protein n=1 Tax=Pseudonocardia sp. T1-2H TaxID=3128899 RepID=UPI00310194D0
MLTWFAQAPAPESGGWTVTTWIAAVGAVISVATLVVTTTANSKRERTKWARETLVEAFFDFVNSSYDAGQAGKDYFKAAAACAEPEKLKKLIATLDEERDKLIHVQTRIRLLAPNKTLQAARQLRRRVNDLRDSLERNTSWEEHGRLVDAIADARENFVVLAKEDMSLPK